MEQLTIGQLAKRVGLRTSTLRYYEAEGLLLPTGRSPSGYRLYDPAAERTLRFIQQAQRLGFSLADIRALLQGMGAGAVVALAEQRFLDLERRLTVLLVQRHELEHILLELRTAQQADEPAQALFDRLLDRVCASPLERSPADSMLEWLTERTGCALSTPDAQAVLNTLRGRHVHIWQSGDAYRILVIGHDSEVARAVEQLVELDAGCQLHTALRARQHGEGTLLIARGENAFIWARLFLALETE